ncbi:hypothetical protein [Ancylomarina sp. 16SWW S1-10-2]|uniref:hypothetical protein n=1 Tax=Ancylomarina sp. 16SWW S1-10-2 TaxID=2499681 RepID=UPI0012ADA7B8|nr:hypothetical protein [Ancylomarina sp. 16SWW S1-10-2]MRT94354.1 hypothetical protein [Ancylomarina sp. 16SWW S1-10-2]
MENIDFSIDSKEKSKLSKGAKIFSFVFGLVLIINSVLYVQKSIKLDSFDSIIFFSVIVYAAVGILFISRVFVGRDFMSPRKYISLTSDSITIKRQFKKEEQLEKGVIEWIAIKPSSISIKTNESMVDFNLNWISYNDLQLLRGQFAEFCDRNKIEIK